jgi:hypothetical protein
MVQRNIKSLSPALMPGRMRSRAMTSYLAVYLIGYRISVKRSRGCFVGRRDCETACSGKRQDVGARAMCVLSRHVRSTDTVAPCFDRCRAALEESPMQLARWLRDRRRGSNDTFVAVQARRMTEAACRSRAAWTRTPRSYRIDLSRDAVAAFETAIALIRGRLGASTEN